MPHRRVIQPNVLIVTVGRSGSSALAEAVSRLGWRLPEKLLPADERNPRGYFEPAMLYQANERLITELGLKSKRRPPEQVPPGLKAGAVGSWRHAFEGREPWVWKDPRLTWTLPLWERWGVVQPTDVVLFVWRNPPEVEASLGRGERMWREWNGRLLELHDPARWLVVAHHDLMADPHRIVKVVADRIGAPDRRVEYAAKAVKPDEHRHHRMSLCTADDMVRELLELSV